MIGFSFIRKHRIGLICRVKDEFFVKEFVAYYLSQGVDFIYIIDDDSSDKSVYDSLLKNEQVSVMFEKDSIVKNSASKVYKSIRHQFDWMIFVDADEFITTKKNSTHTIRMELETTFSDVDCVKVPWVMMACNGLEKNPESILETNVYRWDNDLRHPNKVNNYTKFSCRYDFTGVKCIFRTKHFKDLKDHFPIEPSKFRPKVVDGVYKKKIALDYSYHNLREKDVKEGFLLCYHYRIISVENCLNKLKTNKWYIDDGYTLEDLMSTDYSEIYDDSLSNKFKRILANQQV